MLRVCILGPSTSAFGWGIRGLSAVLRYSELGYHRGIRHGVLDVELEGYRLKSDLPAHD